MMRILASFSLIAFDSQSQPFTLVQEDAFYGTCVRAETGKTLTRPTDVPLKDSITLSCINDAVSGNADLTPVVWFGDSSEISCKADKTFRCTRTADEVKCAVRVGKVGTNCTDTEVMMKLHALCCNNEA